MVSNRVLIFLIKKLQNKLSSLQNTIDNTYAEKGYIPLILTKEALRIQTGLVELHQTLMENLEEGEENEYKRVS